MKKPLLIFILLIDCCGISFSNDFDPDTCLVEKSMVENPNGDKDICVVFTVDSRQVSRFRRSYKELRRKGKYQGDVTLIICDSLEINELRKDPLFRKVNIIKFKNIKFPDSLFQTADCDFKIQPHLNKWYIFHEFFKQWDFIFYIDCGMKFYRPIQPIIDLKEKGKYQSRGTYPHPRKLHHEFIKEYDPECYSKLSQKFNLDVHYPHATTMLFDTSIVSKTTISELIDLMYKFPITCGNDQGYNAIYFVQIRKVYKEWPIKNNDNIYYYHYCKSNPSFEYIMTKPN